MSKSWQSYWLVEALRLKESQWGPVEDAVEVRRAIAGGGSFEQRLLLRAQLIGQRSGWPALQAQLIKALRLSLGLLSLLFVIVGIGAAAGALATSNGQVNIFIALVALLGVPTLSFVLWIASFFMGSGGLGLSRFWLWLSQRLVKSTDKSLLSNALFSLAERQHMMRWTLSAVNHWLWLLALSAACVTLLVLLAAKRYYFNWETTVLSPDRFVVLVQSLGVLPSYLGFLTPDEGIIRQSDGLQLPQLSAAAQVQWSSWLVGCVVVYGVVPRLVAWLCSLFVLRNRSKKWLIDTHQAGLIELRSRLQPAVESVGIDEVAGADQVPIAEVSALRPAADASTLYVGIELKPELHWPPATTIPAAWQDGGKVDSREQRAELLQRLSEAPFEHLLLCVDATQTPDRGVVAWLAELASYSSHCSIYLMHFSHDEENELDAAWHSRLSTAGFKAVYTDFEQLLIDLQ